MTSSKIIQDYAVDERSKKAIPNNDGYSNSLKVLEYDPYLAPFGGTLKAR